MEELVKPEEAARIAMNAVSAEYIMVDGYMSQLKEVGETYLPHQLWGDDAPCIAIYMAGYINGARAQKEKWRAKYGEK